MPIFLALLAAAAAAPICSGTVGEAVAITATPLSHGDLGGERRPIRPGASTTRDWIGALHYDWGLQLRSRDPRFADFDLSPGRVHSASSGCWFNWDSRSVDFDVVAIANPRISESGYTDSWAPPQPRGMPILPGYRFVAADDIRRDGFAWIGIWNAVGAADRAQIVAFGPDGHRVLATLPVRLGGIAQLPDLHSQAYALTLIGEGKRGRPVPWLRLTWP